ncbi:DUF1850 domain-containing protein [Sporosarcina sp. G11-34]|uniref:DUF1850 domain-containing protein n=1 Tax=Sporosarcina sp. G11-34 TaxID=2849605 RepID=UPI0022A9472E|nr:DUF1850 domain-containing protein [Sporosarcina sp. G11-34]MCZ2256887.1 DUF1850 domain-containing protein [Sporosarcina sp. G11-34]
MNNSKITLFILLFIVFLFLLLFIPFREVILFTEQRTEKPKEHYVPLKGEMKFGIRYVHSIHLTDVIETYEVTEDSKIRFLSMSYESLGIGLPGYAADGETFLAENGMYTLTYNDHVIDSFVLFIAAIDEDLALRYKENELNLKEKLEKGKSYKVNVVRKSLYQLSKGVDINEAEE